METGCKMNLEDYPFDSQSCPVIVSTWSEGVDIDMTLVPRDVIDGVTDKGDGSQWDIINTTITKVGLLVA